MIFDLPCLAIVTQAYRLTLVDELSSLPFLDTKTHEDKSISLFTICWYLKRLLLFVSFRKSNNFYIWCNVKFYILLLLLFIIIIIINSVININLANAILN